MSSYLDRFGVEIGTVHDGGLLTRVLQCVADFELAKRRALVFARHSSDRVRVVQLDEHGDPVRVMWAPTDAWLPPDRWRARDE